MSATTSRRVLIAWELGGNLGHVAPLLEVARALRDRGHPVVFALRDLSNADLLARNGFTFLPAPAPRRRRAPSYRSYAEMLVGEVFPSVRASFVGALAWRSIFRTVKPDVLLADHAPAALLAARGTTLRRVICGVPFAIPPTGAALPRFAGSVAAAAEVEAALLARLNSVLAVLRGPALDAAADLYRADAVALHWLPELDYFGPRPRAQYAGPVLSDAGDATAAWPRAAGTKLLVYLRAADCVPPLLEAVRFCEASVLAYVPRAGAELARAARDHGVYLADSPLRMSALLPQSDALVCHGGSLSCAAALAGKPQLLYPRYVEQHLSAQPAVKAGLAAVASVKTDAKRLSGYIESLAPGAACSRAAGSFARRQDARLRAPVDAVVRCVEGSREEVTP